MPKISALNEITNPTADDILAGVDDSAETTKYVKIGTLLKMIYPVGSIYTNATDDTNPATLFGFGTWVAFGAGRVPVGVDTGDAAFDTPEETGGEKTHQLSMAELPVHGLSFSHHGDEGGSVLRSIQATNGTTGGAGAGVYRPPNGQTGGAGSAINPSWSFGGNGAHNNLQPYITVYMWKRTA